MKRHASLKNARPVLCKKCGQPAIGTMVKDSDGQLVHRICPPALKKPVVVKKMVTAEKLETLQQGSLLKKGDEQ